MEESSDPKSHADHRDTPGSEQPSTFSCLLALGEGRQESSLCKCCWQDQVHHSLVPVLNGSWDSSRERGAPQPLTASCWCLGEVSLSPSHQAAGAWEVFWLLPCAVSPQAANTDIGWTLGFMLNFTNMIPAEALQHVKGHPPGLWAGAVSLLVLAIVAGLVAAFLHSFWKTK